MCIVSTCIYEVDKGILYGCGSGIKTSWKVTSQLSMCLMLILSESILVRNNWRSLCQSGSRNFEISCIYWLREERQQRKVSANIPIDVSQGPCCCIICGVVCRSLMGLKHLIWHEHKNWMKLLDPHVKIDGGVHFIYIYIYYYYFKNCNINML